MKLHQQQQYVTALHQALACTLLLGLPCTYQKAWQ